MKGYCVYCMQPSDGETCSHCGRSASAYQPEIHQLQPGTILNDKYLLGAVLGEGGFGITYVGRDITLDMKIAVKEYYPTGAVNRNHTYSAEITKGSGKAGEHFEKGKVSFLTEARTLAKFASEPSCVAVRDFFEENNTAYIVMEYLEGSDLKDCLQMRQKMSFEEVYSLLRPVMQVLAKVHAQGLIHRDISPANIMVLSSGNAKLLDFGAARTVSADGEKSLSILLKPGYAPEEQYRTKGKQGPWTDIYALSATIYKLLTGVTPEDSMNRVFEDNVEPISKLNPSVTPEQESVVLKGMAVRMEERYQNMQEMIAAYDNCMKPAASSMISSTVPAAARKTKPEKTKKTDKKPNRLPKFALLAGAGVIGVFLIVLTIVIVMMESDKPSGSSGGSSSSSITSEESYKDSKSVEIRDQSVSIAELEELQGYTQLSELSLINCELTDAHLEEIGKLVDLKILDLSGNTAITDFSALNHLPNLHTVYLNDIPDLDLTSLQHDQLIRLYCNRCELKDLSFCSSMPSLLKIDASGNRITDINALSQHPLLENMELFLNDNAISDLSALKDTEGPKTLHLSGNQITDLSPLDGHSNINTLYVNGNQITDLSPLKDCFKIKYLDISYNYVRSLGPLATINELTELTFHHNQISSLEPLKNCQKLRANAGTEIDARYNMLDSLEGIEAFAVNSSPTRIYLSHNMLTDITALTSIPSAKSVYLNENNLHADDLNVLIGFKDLNTLEMIDNPLDSVEPLTNQSQEGYALKLSDMTVRLSYHSALDFPALKEDVFSLVVFDPDSERTEYLLTDAYIPVRNSDEYYAEEYDDAYASVWHNKLPAATDKEYHFDPVHVDMEDIFL